MRQVLYKWRVGGGAHTGWEETRQWIFLVKGQNCMQEPRSFEPDRKGVWKRRCLSIPLYVVVGSLLFATLPVTLCLAGIRDLVKKTGWASVRVLLFLTWYFFCEAWGVFVCLWLWLAWLFPGVTRHQFLRWNFRLQGLWTRALFAGGQFLFGFQVHAKNLLCGQRGPYFLFVRHASMADTVLASAFLSVPYRLALRYVMKRELLWDPCLDIVGNRLPNVFVRRGSDDSQKEIERVRQLADHLSEEDGVLIYPEGTRFTPRRREQILTRFRDKGDEEAYTYAASLTSVLPPRLGGTLALLDAAPHVDVVFFVHTGFEQIRTFWDLWNGRFIGKKIHIELWRVPAHEIPREEEAQKQWLLQEWKKVGDWVERHQNSRDSG